MLEIDRLLHGSIDMHLHHGPDALVARRVDVLEAAQQARQAGMRAIVLKNHSYPTAAVASIARQIVPEVATFGSICLDYEAGGLNPHAVKTAAKLGTKVVWMPTFTAKNARLDNPLLRGLLSEGTLTILDGRASLLPEVVEILEIIRDFDMILATGHLGPDETMELVSRAANIGITKIVITHPLDVEIFHRALSINDLVRLGEMGAVTEVTFYGLLPNVRVGDPAHFAEAIKTIGAERCIISTDLGQANNPLPSEGMRMFMATMLANGISSGEIELMAKTNPARLLGVE